MGKKDKSVEETLEMVEVNPQPESPQQRLQQAQKELEAAEGEVERQRKELGRKAQEERNKELREKYTAEERQQEDAVLSYAAQKMEKLKAEAGDLAHDPDFLLGLIATMMVYEARQWNTLHNEPIFRFVRAYKRNKS